MHQTRISLILWLNNEIDMGLVSVMLLIQYETGRVIIPGSETMTEIDILHDQHMTPSPERQEAMVVLM